MQPVTGLAFRNLILPDPLGFLGTDLVAFPIDSTPIGITAWDTLTANAVVPGPLNDPGGKWPVLFSSRKFDHADGVDVLPVHPPADWIQGGARYSIDIDPNGTTAAYLLPWMWDTGYWTLLGTDADLFFTAMLSGCALGWTREADGRVRVGHANIQGPYEADEAAMAEALADYDHCLLPSDYRTGGAGLCNVVGVRTVAGWTLYAQKFDLGVDPPYVIRSVGALPM